MADNNGFWGYILTGVLGIGVGAAIASSGKKKTVAAKNSYFVYVLTKERGATTWELDSFKKAKEDFEKYAESKEISYKEITEKDETAKKLYDALEEKGKNDFKLSKKFPITKIELILNQGDKDEILESKKF